MSSKSRVKAKTARKRPQRATSNVFAMFDQSQIQEFKEAFNMIDQNRDGFVDKEDLHDMLASLGNLCLLLLPVTCKFFMSTDIKLPTVGCPLFSLTICKLHQHLYILSLGLMFLIHE